MTYAPERNTTHVRRAREKLLGQFDGLPVLTALVDVRARRRQDLENAAWEVADYLLDLSRTFGQGLDQIGALVGCGRQGLSDAAYLVALRCQLRIIRSSGSILDTLAVGALATGGLTVLVYVHGQASYTVRVVEALDTDAVAPLIRALAQVRPLGHNARLSYSVAAPAVQLVLGWSGGTVAAAAPLGWSGGTVAGAGLLSYAALL